MPGIGSGPASGQVRNHARFGARLASRQVSSGVKPGEVRHDLRSVIGSGRVRSGQVISVVRAVPASVQTRSGHTSGRSGIRPGRASSSQDRLSQRSCQAAGQGRRQALGRGKSLHARSGQVDVGQVRLWQARQCHHARPAPPARVPFEEKPSAPLVRCLLSARASPQAQAAGCRAAMHQARGRAWRQPWHTGGRVSLKGGVLAMPTTTGRILTIPSATMRPRQGQAPITARTLGTIPTRTVPTPPPTPPPTPLEPLRRPTRTVLETQTAPLATITTTTMWRSGCFADLASE